MNNSSEELILEMFNIGCLKFSPENPFTYTSGLKGPIYCDNRLIPTHPRLRNLVARGFSKIIDKNKINYDLIVGVATAGITHASFLANVREEPMAYTRSKPKGHGQQRMVEGDVFGNENLLLVEDLVNQGSSLTSVVTLLREQGFKISSALCIVDYNTPKALESLKKINVDLFSLINFKQITDMALSQNLIDRTGYEILDTWQKNPLEWCTKS